MINPYEVFSELRPMMRIVADELKNIEFESVLELGCGYGENLLAIEKTFENKRVVGVDVNLDRLDVARKNTNAELLWDDINDLRIKDKSFDVVFTNALFCMLTPPEVEHGIKEMIRVAKKYIILVELNSADAKFGKVGTQRTAVNWKQLFAEYGLDAKLEKIPLSVWDTVPWCNYGYKIVVQL